MAQAQRAGDDGPPTIILERPDDAPAIDALVAQAFGPGRFAKTAERLRENSRPVGGLSFVALRHGVVIGTVRLWPIEVADVRLAFLGPIAVDRGRRGEGLGAALVERAVAEARAQGWPGVLLVGDEPYFGRFGFQCAPIALPGPVDPRRVLLCDLSGETLTAAFTAAPGTARVARD